MPVEQVLFRICYSVHCGSSTAVGRWKEKVVGRAAPERGRTARIGEKTPLHRQRTPQHLTKRGKMMLAAAERKRQAESARDRSVHIDMVRPWRGRRICRQVVPLSKRSISERFEDLPRSGQPPEIAAAPRCQIVALVCEAPSDRPISQWTDKEIALEIMRRGIVQQISSRQASRLFTKRISNRTCFAPGSLLQPVSSEQKRSKRCTASISRAI